MYSLGKKEKLDAERDRNSSREILWRNLADRKKSGRMVRRIYNKTREEMVQSRQERCQKWSDGARTNLASWIREPEPSVFLHTFRDRKPGAEIGPANGHVSGRKYIPRLVLSGGGELDQEKTAELAHALSIPSQTRGNDPQALQNPCRPTIIISDTAKIRGRIEHPHWEPPRYFLRPREKAKEIGPDVQYADRNDMQRIFSGVVKNSIFSWGKYDGGGPWDAPSCRYEKPEKWVGDQPFYPGFRYRDNQRETLAGEAFPPDLLNAGDYRRPTSFCRDRHPDKELPRHSRFRLVVRSGEYACPDGDVRRSLRYEQEPPQPYPGEKTYFTSLRAVPVTPARNNPRTNGLSPGGLRTSASLGSLRGGVYTKREGKPHGGGVPVRQDRDKTGRLKGSNLSSSKSSTAVRFFGGSVQAGGRGKNNQIAEEPAEGEGEGLGLDAKVAGGMRRGSEMASWATCGAAQNSARDYLW